MESTKWLTIFAEEMKSTEFFSGKGKNCKDLFSRQKPTASPTGKPRTRVGYKAAFLKKCLNVVRLPLIRPKLRFVHLPPEGKAWKEEEI
ncbi:MAG: hypothetical protein KID07_03130 [Firmicutes bacterium]|nr:hypothetical protein [Bacillota bacterium]